VKVLVRIGRRHMAGFEQVPTLTEITTNADDKAVLDLAEAPCEVGQAVAAPPGLPPERLAILRQAFDATMKDPAFLAFTRKREMPVVPMTGDELHRQVVRVMAMPKSVVQRTIALVGGM
jgi:hypothetical protein